MRFQLTQRGIELSEEFERLFGDKECECHELEDGIDFELCDYCLHPGNPQNIQEDDRNITGIITSKKD